MISGALSETFKVGAKTLPCQQQTTWVSAGSRQQQQSDQPAELKIHMIKITTVLHNDVDTKVVLRVYLYVHRCLSLCAKFQIFLLVVCSCTEIKLEAACVAGAWIIRF